MRDTQCYKYRKIDGTDLTLRILYNIDKLLLFLVLQNRLQMYKTQIV